MEANEGRDLRDKGKKKKKIKLKKKKKYKKYYFFFLLGNVYLEKLERMKTIWRNQQRLMKKEYLIREKANRKALKLPKGSVAQRKELEKERS